MRRRKKHSMPVEMQCRNCGTMLNGRYCHECGQDVFKGMERSVFKLGYVAVENAFSLDGKVFTTLKRLLFFPGFLSKAYINGKINRYVHPSKLFWFISLLFFTTLTWTITSSIAKEKARQAEEHAVAQPAIQPTAADSLVNIMDAEKAKQTIEPAATQPAAADSLVHIRLGAGLDEFFKTDKFNFKLNKKTDIEQAERYISNISTLFPYVSIVIIPFFALLLLMFFRHRGLAYIDHFIFALHFHTFVFLLFLILIIVNKLFPTFAAKSSIVIGLLLPYLYFSIAIYHFYKPRIIGLIIRPFLIVGIYSIALTIVTLGIIVFAAFLM